MATSKSQDKQQPKATLHRNPNAPILFVDQVAALGIGPNVSKVTFATEDISTEGPAMSEVVTLTMPTNLLFEFAVNVMDAFQSPDLQATFSVSSEAFVKKLQAIALKTK